MRTDQSVALNQLNTDGILSPRLLKPAQQLRRLLSVRLGVVSTTLRDTLRQARAMALMERFFPAGTPTDGTQAAEWSGQSLADEWNGTLFDFFRSVENAGWFGLYWEGLELLGEFWWNDDYDGDNPDHEPDASMMLADFLVYIPVQYFNFGEEDWLNRVAEELPILCLIRGLVDPTYQLNISELRVEYDIWDNDLGPACGSTVGASSFDPATFGVPPDTDAPLCWLPDVVRFCARATGNELLDTGVEAIWEHDWSTYQWDRPQDIKALKRLYPPALRAWERIKRFLKWCDGPEEVDQMLELLFRGQETEDNDG